MGLGLINHIGILATNNSLWQWSLWTNGMVSSMIDAPIIDIISINSTNGCICTISAINGSLTCNYCGAPTPALSRVAVIDHITAGPLNASNQLTGVGGTAMCLLLDGTATCSGPGVERFRWGGYAMQPRQSFTRIVHIATNGIDAPFCGLHYFKACATINYAFTLIESSGPWIEFVYAPGTYDISADSITIDWTGITIRGSSDVKNPSILFFADGKRLNINAPSFRLVHITITQAQPYPTLILINSGMCDCLLSFSFPFFVHVCRALGPYLSIGLQDVMLIDCKTDLIATIEVATDSTLTLIRTIISDARAATLSVTNGALIIIDSLFTDLFAPAILAVNSRVYISNCSFQSSLASVRLLDDLYRASYGYCV
jgi:hypothetical protein